MSTPTIYGGVQAEQIMLFTLLLVGLVVLLILALRWFNYRERMAIISREMTMGKTADYSFLQSGPQTKQYLAKGVTVALVGLATTLGLLTIGITPILLVGLIPMFIGLAMILSHLITIPNRPKKPVSKQQELPFTKESDTPTTDTNEPGDLSEEDELEPEEEKDSPF